MEQKPHRGVLILVLGIVSLLVCQIAGLAPWLMGGADLKEMEEGRMDPEGKGLTQVGYWLGIVALILLVLGVLVTILMFVLMASVAAAGAAV